MDARLADAARQRTDRRGRPVGRGRAVRRAAARDRRGHPRQDHDAGVLVEGRHRLAAARRHRQPVGPGDDVGRIQRRQRDRGRARHGAVVGRHGRRRVGAHPRRVHRHGRAEADVRADPDLSAEPVRHAVARRADDPDRAGRRRAARRDHRIRRARLVGHADAGDVVPVRARRRGGRPARRPTRPISASSATIPRSTPRSGRPSTCWRAPAPRWTRSTRDSATRCEAFHVLWFSGEAKVLAAYGAIDALADRVDPGLHRTAVLGIDLLGVGLPGRDGRPDGARAG